MVRKNKTTGSSRKVTKNNADGDDSKKNEIIYNKITDDGTSIRKKDASFWGPPLSKWGAADKDEKGRNLILPPVEAIPDDIHKFYKNVGYFTEQHTNKEVRKLAKHQVQAWKDRKKSKYRLYLKSQKIGLSTSILLEDLHIALTRGRGKEIFIVSQSLVKAKDHLQDIKKMLMNSPKYSDFLIDRPDTEEEYMRDERTKNDIMYLRNPGNPRQPTRIIALGITSPGSLISNKRVCHIHISDVTLADMTDERMELAFGGLYSRLMNTRGTMVIEAPPRGPSGPIFNIVDEVDSLKRDGVAIDIKEGEKVQTPQGFLVRRYTYQTGIDAGMMDEDLIEKERLRFGVLFSMYYEADFYTSDKTWFTLEHSQQTSDEATAAYDSD